MAIARSAVPHPDIKGIVEAGFVWGHPLATEPVVIYRFTNNECALVAAYDFRDQLYLWRMRYRGEVSPVLKDAEAAITYARVEGWL